MHHKRVGNLIYGRRLDVDLLKTQSTTVEMFENTKMMLFSAKKRNKCRGKRKSIFRLKNQLMKREF